MNIINTYNKPLVKQKGKNGYEHISLTAVLTEGAVGDKAVYVGIGTPEWVARNGTKLSYKEAVAGFYPMLPEEEYRR